MTTSHWLDLYYLVKAITKLKLIQHDSDINFFVTFPFEWGRWWMTVLVWFWIRALCCDTNVQLYHYNISYLYFFPNVVVTLNFPHLLWIMIRYEQNFLKGANVRCILSVIRITKDTICWIIVIRCTWLTVMDEIHQSILKTYLHNPFRINANESL